MLAPSGGAYRGDAQYGAVGLFVVAEHVEDLLRSCSRAERIIFGFDLAGLRRAGLAEIMLVVGAVVVLFLLLRLFGFHLVPLDFDDFGGSCGFQTLPLTTSLSMTRRWLVRNISSEVALMLVRVSNVMSELSTEHTLA